MKSAGQEGFIGCTKKYNIYFEGDEGEGICAVVGGKICRHQGVDDFGTRKHDN